MGRFGYEYPAGAEYDSNAPWNQEDCDRCGFSFHPDDLDEEGKCEDCADN